MSVGTPTARIIVVSDRIVRGEREDCASPTALAMLEQAGFLIDETRVIPEGTDAVERALDEALAVQVPFILTCGGTGIGPKNYTPEATEARICMRLHGVETQVLIEGLKHSSRAGLCRGVIGLTSREPGASLIVNAPSSRGGVADTLSVVIQLWPSLAEWM